MVTVRHQHWALPSRTGAAGAALALALTAVSAGCGPTGGGVHRASTATDATPTPAATGSPGRRPSDELLRFRSLRATKAQAVPVRLRIPAAGVDAQVVRLGRGPGGTVAVPARWGDIGWYDQGPLPGDPGPAVLLGHVDSRSGPAVFYRLHSLHRGDRVDVVRADGSDLRFRVRSVAEYPKRHFPTEAVYLPTLTPLLQLITCGGDFDYRSGHYVDNYVVTAAPA